MFIRPANMWRAFFSAIGIVVIIMGFECLVIDSAILAAGVVDDPAGQAQQQAGLFGQQIPQAIERVFRPSEWFPWSLLASGSIVLLYSISLRKNV